MPKKQNDGVGTGVVIAATAALAGLGAYVVYGTKAGKPVKKAIKSGVLKAKAELLEKVEAMESVTEDAYHSAVDAVVGKYKAVVDDKDAQALEKELRSYWKALKAQTAKVKKAAKKVGNKAVKKVVKKVAPKKAAKK